MKLIIDIPDNELKDPLKNIHLLIDNGVVGEVCIKKYDKDKPYFMDLNYAPLSESEDCVSRQAVLDLPKNTERDFSGKIIEQSINIEYIKALPSVTPAEKQEPCDDCIRREDALMALTGEYMDSPIEILPKAIKRINALPPVSPIEKVGNWILQPSNKEQGERDFIWWKCSECGQVIFSETEQDRREYHAYCGRCGAKMDVPDNNVGEMGGEQE